MTQFVDLILSADMLTAAHVRNRANPGIKRDRGSKTDHLVGTLGEMLFVEWLWGDWRRHHPKENHGRVDVAGRIEVKASAVQLSVARYMLGREEYIAKRSAEFYVQILFGTRVAKDHEIIPGMTCRIAGWARHDAIAGRRSGASRTSSKTSRSFCATPSRLETPIRCPASRRTISPRLRRSARSSF